MIAYELTRSDGGKSVMWIAPDVKAEAEFAKWEESANGVTVVSSREMTAAEVSAYRQRRAAERQAAAAAPALVAPEVPL